MDLKSFSYVVASLGELFGGGSEGSFGPGVDAICGHCDDFALLGGKLREHVGLETSQHETLV